MATNTYVALTTTTGTGSSATVSFTSIPSTYTDLVIVGSIRSTSSTSIMRYRYNGATTNYSATTLYGTGSAAGSFRTTGESGIYGIGGSGTYVASASNTFTSFTLNVSNYANSTTYKTSLLRTGGSANPETNVGLWRATPTAINQIDLVLDAGSFTSDSTFTLYGIAKGAEVPTTAKATGGTITYGIDYTYHVFTSSGTFTPNQALTADVLVVAGGGAGGGDQGGGGGAGGLLQQTGRSLTSGTGYTCTVGAGGTVNGTTTGNSGSNSVFDTITALGGGAGARNAAGVNGGSGGGGGYNGLAGGSATQGNSGGATGYGNAGSAHNSTDNLSGAGGGAGTAGNPPLNSTTSGAGGAGLNTWSEWLLTTGKGVNGYIAGGGGGGNYAPQGRYAGAGGAGGGGAGADTNPSTGTAGTVNTGSGGGGGAGAGNAAGAGGSGIVIIRYAN